MARFEDVMMVEGVDGYEAETQEQYYEALQRMIDDGTVWHLQGFFGRTAARAIEEGYCHKRE